MLYKYKYKAYISVCGKMRDKIRTVRGWKVKWHEKVPPFGHRASLSIRAHKFPFFDKCKLRALVEKPIPYRHAVQEKTKEN